MESTLKYAYMMCPFPTNEHGGKLRQGARLGQCQMCQRCAHKECSAYGTRKGKDAVTHIVCPFGLSVFIIALNSDILIVNGLVEPELNTKCAHGLRRRLKNHRVRIDQIREWRSRFLEVTGQIQRDIDLGVAESVSSLHDVKTAVSLVCRNAEGLVQNQPGGSFDEKVEAAEPRLKSLLKSVSLLNTRMSMASIVANPESVRFGLKRPFPVYKVFDKMVHLFQELANQRRVDIRMVGYSVGRPAAFDSIESLALVLLDNAVKYSEAGSEVIVRVYDVNEGETAVSVEVDSLGPVVAEEERARIFEKRYRSESGKGFAGAGSGLGLYIARLIAEAHGFRLVYRAQPQSLNSGTGHNIFSFQIG